MSLLVWLFRRSKLEQWVSRLELVSWASLYDISFRFSEDVATIILERIGQLLSQPIPSHDIPSLEAEGAIFRI